MTSPMLLGHAIVPANTDLDALAQSAANASANAVSALAGVASNTTLINSVIGGVPAPAYSRVVSTLQSFLDHIPTLHAADFAPDGYVWGVTAATDTTYAQAALTSGATNHKVVNFGSLVVKLSGGLACSGPGLIFDHSSYGSAGDPGFLVTGTGYTALTITSSGAGGNGGTQFRFTVYGTGNAVNGVYFANPLLSQFQKVRVYNLAGYGMLIDRSWDCTFQDLSVELCNPTGTTYSFAMIPGGDTCNMTHIGRLQVERCGVTNGRVISIDASTLSTLVDVLHSEQATGVAGVDTWYLGASRGTFNVARFSALNPSSATLHLAGGNATYANFLVEGAIDVSVDAGSASSTVTLLTPEIQGTFHPTSGQAGTIVTIGGSIAATTDPTLAGVGMVCSGGLRIFGTRFTTLTIGFQAGFDPTVAKFVGCKIGTLVSTSTTASATFVGCEIAEAGNLLGGVNVFAASTVTTAALMALTTSRVVAQSSTLAASGMTYINSRPIRGFGSSFPQITKLDAGTTDCVFDSGTTVGPSSTGVGIPTGGAHIVGEYHKNAVPVVGSPVGWVCTVAGTPGTWVALANV